MKMGIRSTFSSIGLSNCLLAKLKKVMKKKSSYVKLHRWDYLERMKVLKDQEKVLFLTYTMLADWDERHEDFGLIKKSIRELQKEVLPDWSIGKISMTTKSLILKNFLARKGRFVSVEHYWLFRSGQTEAQWAFSQIEQGVQLAELSVQRAERKKAAKLKQEILNVSQKLGIY